jgi:S1-C subfamily serine protease
LKEKINLEHSGVSGVHISEDEGEKDSKGGWSMKLLVCTCLVSLLLVGIAASSELDRLEGDIKILYDRVSPSIVSVHYGTDGEDDFVGTGVVLDTEGHIVTIKRFISDDTIWVETDTGERLGAELVGRDSETGIAVLKVGKSLRAANVCPIKELVGGDLLFVIGNSFGVTNGISLGIFSGKREGDEFLQMGNAILPGNTGAGVFNSKGELVGIVSFALRTSIFYGIPDIKSFVEKEVKIKIGPEGNLASSEGPGVVIPCERMNELCNEIIAYGKIERGWIGVFIKEQDGKVVVSGLVDDGPAREAGVQKEDVILSFDGKDVKELQEFVQRVKAVNPGSKVKMVVERDKKKKTVEIEVRPRPDDSKLFRLREIMPDLKFELDKEELKKLKEDLEKMKEDLKELEKDK